MSGNKQPVSASPACTHTCFYTGRFRYRKWYVLLPICVATPAGAMLVVAVVRDMGPSSGLLMALFHLLLLSIGLLFVWVGLYLLTRFMRGKEIAFKIDEDGVHYGQQTTGWSEIARFRGVRYTGGFAFEVSRHGLGRFRPQTLTIDAHMTDQEYDRLVSTLRATVGCRHPRLQFGGLVTNANDGGFAAQ